MNDRRRITAYYLPLLGSLTLIGAWLGTAIEATTGAQKPDLARSTSVTQRRFDLERPDEVVGPPAGPGIDMTVIPVHVGKVALAVTVTMGNLDTKPVLLPGIEPYIYEIEFRNRDRDTVDAYRPVVGTPRIRDVSGLTLLYPANSVTATFILPTYYSRIRTSGIQCRARCHMTYFTTGDRDRQHTFDLASRWIPVPP
jgi:hypothetical protein